MRIAYNLAEGCEAPENERNHPHKEHDNEEDQNVRRIKHLHKLRRRSKNLDDRQHEEGEEKGSKKRDRKKKGGGERKRFERKGAAAAATTPARYLSEEITLRHAPLQLAHHKPASAENRVQGAPSKPTN